MGGFVGSNLGGSHRPDWLLPFVGTKRKAQVDLHSLQTRLLREHLRNLWTRYPQLSFEDL